MFHSNIPLPPFPHPQRPPLLVHLTAAAERRLRNGTYCLGPEDIRHQDRPGEMGDWVTVWGRKRTPVAVGLYDPLSSVRVRLFSAQTPFPITETWLTNQVAAAVAKRSFLANTNTTGFRLAHGENDGLPGLVLDRYDQVLVLKLYTAAWIPHLQMLLKAIHTACPMPQLVLRLTEAIQQNPDLLYHLENGLTLWGDGIEGPLLFQENGLTFEADVVAGLRTGFFFDQRDNRMLLRLLSRNKTVLVGYAHTGSFSLYAAAGGAKQIVSLSASQPALATALRQFNLNQALPDVAAADHELLVGDIFLSLDQLYRSQRRFDMVLMAPMPLAQQADEIESALDVYAKLTRRAVRVLRPRGTFFMTSRSNAVPAPLFYETIHKAAQRVWRPLQEIQRTGLPADHPAVFLEDAYLKGVIATA